MAHTVRELSKLLGRVRRIKGQLTAVERGLIEHRDCGELLQQIAACRGAINGLMAQVLEGHVREHIVDADRRPTKRETEAIEELIGVLRSYLR